MKSIKLLFRISLVLSIYLISCYPEKKVLGHYSNGKIKAIRYYKRHDTLNERYVFYYDNGQEQYVRYWRNDLMQVYKMKSWYRNGAKKQTGWMKEKDTSRKYSNSDSEFVFTGLYKESAKGWYQNGKIRFKMVVTKDHFLLVNHYDSLDMRTRQEFIKQIRPDNYDTVQFRTEKESNGKKYTQTLNHNGIPTFLLDE
jgi:hypothetical protein